MQANYRKYLFNFKRPSGTSRGVLTQKETWFLILEGDGNFGIGECGLFRGLSADDVPEYEDQLKWVCASINLGKDYLLRECHRFPSIQFGIEQAFLSLNSHSPFELFRSAFTLGEASIPINGLIWMGDEAYMHEQIREKLNAGFKCIKMKIGALDFDKEIALLRSLRKKYGKDKIELRVDANGAFDAHEALFKLEELAKLEIHSIEQPIKQGNFEQMKALCSKTPLPIALDEELIGVIDVTEKEKLLQTIQPQFIILKPSLVGGFAGSTEWITLAEKFGIGWWVTSALESNVGLNAIAQWTYSLGSSMYQGLGTGTLFINNFESPLEVRGGQLSYAKEKKWKTNLIHELCI